MKNLQASYNEGANKIAEQAAQAETVKENLNLLTELATIASQGYHVHQRWTLDIQQCLESSWTQVMKKIERFHLKGIQYCGKIAGMEVETWES